MPASHTPEELRGARVFSAMFWVGVALAPIAALMLLIGSSTGSLRAAVGLVIISVILIGLSITLRKDSEGLKGELEDTMFDEIDSMRADVRDDIAHAAQATHRAFGEKLQYLMDQVESTRVELETTRAQLEAVRHQQIQGPPTRAGGPPGPSAQPGQRPGIPPGLVRHTETVQVTTRHTVMDPREEGGRGTTYGPRQQPVSARGGATPQAHDREDSWTDQRLREQLERRRDAVEPVSADRWQQEPREERWSAPIVDEDDDRRPGVRAGDRWASVRQDDRGRELRMGERRAALHSDGSGTELRIEDRWAAVRREAGLDRGRWEDEDDRLDAPPDFPYRDQGREGRDRRAITGSDRDDRWSDYDERDRDRDRDRDREKDRDRDRYR